MRPSGKVTVPPEQIRGVALFVRDALGFDHLNVVGGTDYMQQHEFEVIYFVGSISTPGQQDLVVQLAERVKRDESPRSRRSRRSGAARNTTRGRPSRCSG